MQPKSGAALDDTTFDLDVVGLLEADAVAVVVAHEAVADHAMIAAIEEDAGGAAAVHLGRVFRAIAVHGQVLHAGVFKLVAADDREDRGRKAAVRHQDVGVHGSGEGEVVAAAVQDRRANAMKVALALGRHIDAAPDVKALRLFHRDGRLAEIAICRQRRAMLAILLQHGLFPGAAHGHAAAKVERIAHEILARTDLHHAAAQVANVIHGGLQGAVVPADDVRVLQADGDLNCGAGVEFVFGVFASSLVGERERPEQDDAENGESGHASLHHGFRGSNGERYGSPTITATFATKPVAVKPAE